MKTGWMMLGALGLSTLGASTAEATSGTVSGQLTFYQNQGSYCPTTRNCTGANYLQAEFNANVPVSDTNVYVKDVYNNVVGRGVTDANGFFAVSYFSNLAIAKVRVAWKAEHKDGRFAIRDANGSPWSLETVLLDTVDGGNVNFGIQGWGSAGAPHTVANVYDGAYKMWRYGLSQSNRMVSYFTGAEVRAFHSTANTTDGKSCPTSCAYGSLNRIYLDSGAPFMPQHRIMHELGHLASYKGSNNQSFVHGADYTRDGTAGWSLRSGEHDAANFEEGFATFLADAALYQPSAPQPHTCILSAAACTNNVENVETSVGLRGTCQADERRFALTVDRFLWDAYDTVQDSNYYSSSPTLPGVFMVATEGSSHPYWAFLDMVSMLDAGNGDNQKEEPWCAGYLSLCDLDGRSAFDLKVMFGRWRGDRLDLQRSNNCSPGAPG